MGYELDARPKRTCRVCAGDGSVGIIASGDATEAALMIHALIARDYPQGGLKDAAAKRA